MKKEGKY